MNCDEFFYRAVPAALRKYPSPDSNDLIAAVRERAGKMEKHKKTGRVIFNAAAGTAAAVAVIGGSALGLNWLNEHGGLKEGGTGAAASSGTSTGTSTEAAYQEEVTEAASDQVAGQESRNILDAAGDVIKFEGLTATIEQVDFDGTFLRVYYTPSGYEESVGDPAWANMLIQTPPLKTDSDRQLITGSTAYISEIGKNCALAYFDLDEGETAGFFFEFDEKQSQQYYLTGINRSENTRMEYDIGDIEWIRLSPLGAVVAGSENYLRDPHCSFRIRFKDGSSRELVSEHCYTGGASGDPVEEHFGLEPFNRITYFGSVSPEPIDVENIDTVLINGETVLGSDESTFPAVIDFSDCTVNISVTERYGNTIKMTLDAYAKENCDIQYTTFIIDETGERAENKNRVPWLHFFDWSDWTEVNADHLQVTFVLKPYIPEGTERTFLLRKGKVTTYDTGETAYFTITGADTSGAYVREVSAVGTGLTGEEMPIDRIEIDPLSISFDVVGFYAFETEFSIKFRDGRIYTYNKEALVRNGRTWEDQDGNIVCSAELDSVHIAEDGDYFEEKNTGRMRYFIIAEEPIFDVNEIESVNILGAEIPINTD